MGRNRINPSCVNNFQKSFHLIKGKDQLKSLAKQRELNGRLVKKIFVEVPKQQIDEPIIERDSSKDSWVTKALGICLIYLVVFGEAKSHYDRLQYPHETEVVKRKKRQAKRLLGIQKGSTDHDIKVFCRHKLAQLHPDNKTNRHINTTKSYVKNQEACDLLLSKEVTQAKTPLTDRRWNISAIKTKGVRAYSVLSRMTDVLKPSFQAKSERTAFIGRSIKSMLHGGVEKGAQAITTAAFGPVGFLAFSSKVKGEDRHGPFSPNYVPAYYAKPPTQAEMQAFKENPPMKGIIKPIAEKGVEWATSYHHFAEESPRSAECLEKATFFAAKAGIGFCVAGPPGALAGLIEESLEQGMLGLIRLGAGEYIDEYVYKGLDAVGGWIQDNLDPTLDSAEARITAAMLTIPMLLEGKVKVGKDVIVHSLEHTLVHSFQSTVSKTTLSEEMIKSAIENTHENGHSGAHLGFDYQAFAKDYSSLVGDVYSLYQDNNLRGVFDAHMPGLRNIWSFTPDKVLGEFTGKSFFDRDYSYLLDGNYFSGEFKGLENEFSFFKLKNDKGIFAGLPDFELKSFEMPSVENLGLSNFELPRGVGAESFTPMTFNGHNLNFPMTPLEFSLKMNENFELKSLDQMMDENFRNLPFNQWNDPFKGIDFYNFDRFRPGNALDQMQPFNFQQMNNFYDGNAFNQWMGNNWR